MLEQWVSACVNASRKKEDFYSGCRKIHTGVTLAFERPFNYEDVDTPLELEDCGFTGMKLSMLKRLYWDPEHAEQVAELWRGRLERGKYGSVGVSTYHHITKSDPTKRSKRASVMGPCLLAVAFTLKNKGVVAVDAFYRTTELFKKFPADTVFIRDVVIPSMGIKPHTIERLTCHFANVTSHPMYAVTWLAHLDWLRTVDTLESIKRADRRFYDWVLKWTGRYVCPEYHRGIAKFAQALRVQKDALNRITGERLTSLQDYIRGNHPGYRGEYDEADDDDSE